MATPKCLFVSSEALPLAKTGGLGDVCSALPAALHKEGGDIWQLLPGYPAALDRVERPTVLAKLDPVLGFESVRLIAGEMPTTGVPIFLLDCPPLFCRPGSLYVDEDNREFPDNALRFGLFSHAAARLASGNVLPDWRADIVHCNDWHTGLVPLLLQGLAARPASIFTIHNILFQGNFPSDCHGQLGLPEGTYGPDGVEFYGQLSMLKSGIRFADRVTTVSPTYAKEVLTPEFGYGMEGVLASLGRKFTGILNGVDYGEWNPHSDPHLPANYSADDISNKRICKSRLQVELGLPDAPEVPLLASVSRLTHQKMADKLLESLPQIFGDGAEPVQLVVLGQGDRAIEDGLRAAVERYPGQLAVHIGYEEPLAHRIHAGADVMLQLSRFEPCGLTQLYAMRYGTVPVVRPVGGLVDTVVDSDPISIADGSATGFVMAGTESAEIAEAIGRVTAVYRQPLIWRKIQQHGMVADFSWDRSSRAYAAMYRSLLKTTAKKEPQRQTDQPVRIVRESAVASGKGGRKKRVRGGG